MVFKTCLSEVLTVLNCESCQIATQKYYSGIPKALHVNHSTEALSSKRQYAMKERCVLGGSGFNSSPHDLLVTIASKCCDLPELVCASVKWRQEFLLYRCLAGEG